MKRSEKMMVGVGMMGLGVVIAFMVGGEQYTAFQTNTTKAAELQTSLATLETQRQGLAAQKAELEKGVDLPSDIHILTYSPNNKDQVLKQIMDAMVSKIAEFDNTLISLAPQTVDPLIPPPAEGVVDPNNPTAAPADPAAAPPADANAAALPADGTAPPSDATGGTITLGGPAPVAAPTIETYGYAIQMRGTYEGIQGFLKAIADSHDLMELINIKIENEAGEVRSDKPTDTAFEASKPIKLTAVLRVGLQPAK